MELGHAYSVLVVSASAKFNESVRGLLPERFYWPVPAGSCWKTATIWW